MNAIELRSAECGLRIRLHKKRRAVADWKTHPPLFCVSRTEVGYWVAFLCKYLRDGRAEVDHIDVDTEPHGRDRPGGRLKWVMSEHSPPVSSAEARRRLGL